MKMEVKRDRIRIIPDNEIDESYIEEVVGLKKEGECAIARRMDVTSGYELLTGSETMYIEIKKVEIKE